MKLNVEQLVLLGLLAAPLHWIIARSEIARPFWSRTRGWLAKLLACPACSGFWLGLALRAAHVTPVTGVHPVDEFLAAGLLGVIVTPVVEAFMLLGLHYSAVAPDAPEEPAEPAIDVTPRPADEPEADVPPTSPPPR